MKILVPETPGQDGQPTGKFVPKDATFLEILNPLNPTADEGSAVTRLICYAVAFKLFAS